MWVIVSQGKLFEKRVFATLFTESQYFGRYIEMCDVCGKQLIYRMAGKFGGNWICRIDSKSCELIVFGGLKFGRFGNLQIQNDIILTARPLSTRYIFTSSFMCEILSVGCDGVRVCGGELCPRYHVSKNLWDASVGEELPCKKDSGNEKDPYTVAVMRRSTIVSHVPRKISAACLQDLSQIRDRGTVVDYNYELGIRICIIASRARRGRMQPGHMLTSW